MSGYKMVKFMITVPEGDRCYDNNTHCQFYDNEGGHPHCKMGFHIPRIHDIGKDAGKKSPECVILMED